jgi:DUF971 family protein
MSFWDSLKPAKKIPVAVTVTVSPDQKSLVLTWDDGASSSVTARRLRQLCPCAGCVEEMTGRRTLDPESVVEDMKLLEVQPVGNYALSFRFGDAHGTGIYNWEYLRQLST